MQGELLKVIFGYFSVETSKRSWSSLKKVNYKVTALRSIKNNFRNILYYYFPRSRHFHRMFRSRLRDSICLALQSDKSCVRKKDQRKVNNVNLIRVLTFEKNCVSWVISFNFKTDLTTFTWWQKDILCHVRRNHYYRLALIGNSDQNTDQVCM